MKDFSERVLDQEAKNTTLWFVASLHDKFMFHKMNRKTTFLGIGRATWSQSYINTPWSLCSWCLARDQINLNPRRVLANSRQKMCVFDVCIVRPTMWQTTNAIVARSWRCLRSWQCLGADSRDSLAATFARAQSKCWGTCCERCFRVAATSESAGARGHMQNWLIWYQGSQSTTGCVMAYWKLELLSVDQPSKNQHVD